jgi:hypothetical protein
MPSVFAWFSSSWPKTDYKKGPLGVPKGRWHGESKTKKQRDIRPQPKEFGWGKYYWNRLRWAPPPPARSSSRSTTTPSWSYCNLLANMMCGTIYCFPMIYCIHVEVWVVFCSCQLWNTSLIGCIQVCYLLWWYYVLIYECTHMLGNA